MKSDKHSAEIGRGGELNTLIGKGSRIKGDLHVQNSLRVDGKISGNVEISGTVVVGKEGQVEGEMKAKHVLLAGVVRGNVQAKGKVYLESTASVFGDIEASRLVVDEGAVFDGKCNMTRSEPAVQPGEA